MIFALKIGKSMLFRFSHFEGKYQIVLPSSNLQYIARLKQLYLRPKYNKNNYLLRNVCMLNF